MSDGHSLMEKQQQLPVTNDGWNDAAKEAAERALRGASAIRTTGLEMSSCSCGVKLAHTSGGRRRQSTAATAQ